MNDGEVTIGASLVTDKFDRQIAKFSKDLERTEDELNEKAKVKVNVEGDLEVQKRQVQELEQRYSKLVERRIQLEQYQGRASMPGVPTQSLIEAQQEYKNISNELTEIEKKLDSAWKEQDKLSLSAQKASAAYEKTSAKVGELKTKIDGIKLQKQQADVEQMRKGFNSVGSSIQGVVGKVGKMALAVIGIRAAFSAISGAVRELSQQNEELAQRIEWIRSSLAQALLPVVEFIVNVVSGAVYFLGQVLKTLFGIDIFAKSTAKSLDSSVGAAKELRRQLAGFDEMNILNDDGTTGIGSSLGNIDPDAAVNKAEQAFNSFRKWFLGSDKTDFWGIWDDNMEHIKTFVGVLKTSFEPIGKWIDTNVWQPIKLTFGATMEKLKPLIEPIKKKFQEEIDKIKPLWTDLVDNHLKPLWNRFTSWIEPNVIQPFKKAWEPIGKWFYDTFSPWINKLVDWVNRAFGTFGVHLDHWKWETNEAVDDVGENAENTTDKVENAVSDMEQSVDTDIDKIDDNIDDVSNNTMEINTDTTEIDEAKNKTGGLLDQLWNLISHPWEIVTRITTSVSEGFSNIFRGLREKFASWGIQLPFMASGGIVNMPNRGTMIGGAIAGESGAEGVIPLTDAQAMEELGSAIGKHITINATVLNKMNGRVISRSLQQVQADSDFAYNT